MGGCQSAQLRFEIPEAESGLSRQELASLMACWAAIEKDLRTQSIKLFVRFLRAHPDYRRYFRSLAVSGPPIASRVATDARVQTHFRTILTSVGSLATTAATRPQNLPLKYDFLALVHRHMGLTRQDFFNFRDELIQYLRTEFPAEMTQICAEAWYKLLTRVFSEVCCRIEEFRALQPAIEPPVCCTDEDGELEESGKQAAVTASTDDCDKCAAQVLFWDHRKTFWQTQQELWGERMEEEDDDDDDDDPEEVDARRQRARWWWRRVASRVAAARK